MDKLQGWEMSTDQEAKINNIMILEGKNGHAKSFDDDRYFISPSCSTFSTSSSDLDEHDDDYDGDDSNGSSGSSNGPLYELSELLLQLPLKRGLSKFYQGKSRSFKNLGNVKNVNDLAKEVSSNGKGRSRTKCYTTTPKHIICKKSTSSLPYPLAFSRR